MAVLDARGRAYLAVDRDLDWVQKLGAWAVRLEIWEQLKHREGVTALVVYERETGEGWEVDIETARKRMRRVLRPGQGVGAKMLLEKEYFGEVAPGEARPI